MADVSHDLPSDMEAGGDAEISFEPDSLFGGAHATPPKKAGQQPTAGGTNGTNGTEKESDDTEEEAAENGDTDKDKTEEEPMDAEDGEDAEDPEDPEEEDQDQKEEPPAAEEAKTTRRSTRGTGASSATRTPTTPRAQSQNTPTTSRKRGGAVDSPQPSSENRQQPKRQRRNSKETATPLKVEDLDLKPTGKTPTPRTPRSVAKKEEPTADADPYDFQSNANDHPNPMANIGSTQVQVQKQSPGDIRFSVTPKTGTSKYAHTERIASERRGETSTTPMSPLAPGKVTLSSVNLSSPSAEKSISSPATSKKGTAARSSTVGTPRSRKSKVSESGTPSVLSADEYDGKSGGDSQHTSASRRSTKSRGAEPAVGGTPVSKKKVDVPEELGAEEQLNVDHPDEEHNMILRGARVFGEYYQAFYPAIICNADGLSRYMIYYIEDSISKAVPNNGVFPLSKLAPGVTAMISPSPDDLSPNTIGREIEVVSVPDSNNAEEWKEGKFKVRDTDTGEEIIVVWTQFYFRKQDADALKLKETASPLVKESNIVLESRSSRRSRAAINQSAAELPMTPTTTTPRGRRGRQSATKKEDLDKTQSSGDTAADADDAEQDQKSPVLSPSHGDGMKTPENAGPSAPATSARRSSTRGNRIKPSIFSGEADKKAVKFPDNLDEETTPTSTPAKTRASRSTPRNRGNRKSETTADEHPQESEASEAAVDTTQEPMDTTQPPDTAQVEEPASSKRASRGRGARKSSGATAKSAKVAQVPTPVAQKNFTEDEELDTEAQKVPQAIFQNRKFVLTSATRVNRAGQPQFNKREFRTLIEQRGGTVIDDFKGLGEDDEAYLIADTHYRTHKYLSALSLSVPCVHHTWITECIEQDTFVDFKEYMLAAGQALGPDGTIHEYEWKPQKGQLMAGKKVWIHSKNSSDPPVVGFVQLWSPIIKAAGAEVVRDDDVPQDDLQLMQWIAAGNIDIILTDPSCEAVIVESMEASDGGEVVGSEWVIEALITGELPDTTNARYRHNA